MPEVPDKTHSDKARIITAGNQKAGKVFLKSNFKKKTPFQQILKEGKINHKEETQSNKYKTEKKYSI